MVDGLQPSGDEATLARRAADRDPRAVAARFFRVMEFAVGGSTPKIREDIIKLPPAVVAQLSRATRAFELTIMPRATPLSEEEFFDEMGIITGEEVIEEVALIETQPAEPVEQPAVVEEPVVDTAPTNPPVVFEGDGTTAPEIEAKIVLKNLFGDVSDLSLTIADAPVIAAFLVSKVEKPSNHPWLQIVQERFENVPVEDVAKKYDFTSAQNFRVLLSIFLSSIKKIAPEQLKAELIPLLSPRTLTPIVAQPKTVRKPSVEKAVVEQKIEEQWEEVVEEKNDPQEMMATYARVLELNDEQQAALLYFLGIDENTPSVQHDEVLAVVNTLRIKIKETFKTLADPKLGLNQKQRRALYPTLGWYVQGGTDIVKFQDPKYVRKYASAGRQNIDIDLLDDAHSAYEQVAKALSA